MRRFSLPDVDESQVLNNAGVFRFPRVSCAAASADDADLDPAVAGEFIITFNLKVSSDMLCKFNSLCVNLKNVYFFLTSLM